MSHRPGLHLEDFLTDLYGVIDADGKHGTGIMRLYTGQWILTKEQFDQFASFFEPVRKTIEDRLLDYSEEENGSWRDYRNFVMADLLPDDICQQAEAYLNGLDVPKTKGLGG